MCGKLKMGRFYQAKNLPAWEIVVDTTETPGMSDFHSVWAQGLILQSVSNAVTPTLAAHKNDQIQRPNAFGRNVRSENSWMDARDWKWSDDHGSHSLRVWHSLAV